MLYQRPEKQGSLVSLSLKNAIRRTAWWDEKAEICEIWSAGPGQQKHNTKGLRARLKVARFNLFRKLEGIFIIILVT